MPNLAILDALSLPGDPGRPNEDRFSHARNAVVVVDGATGLGPSVITGPGQSDAAWLAQFAAIAFEDMLGRGKSVTDAVRAINGAVSRFGALAAPGTPNWALPMASFAGLAIEGDSIVAYGLGDCVLFLVDADGGVHRFSAVPDAAENEIAAARIAVTTANGGRTLDNEQNLDRLRQARDTCNRPGGLWTLGAAPEAADHVVRQPFALALPATGFLATDGFAALVTNYARFDAAGLIAAARNDGLQLLGALLRQTEEVADPECVIWPRYKVSDDATAILFEIGA